MDRRSRAEQGRVAFVLGGGGILGATQVGMLRALFEAGVQPDLVVGTSVGALNGALVAGDPSGSSIERLTDLWTSLSDSEGAGRPLGGRQEEPGRPVLA